MISIIKTIISIIFIIFTILLVAAIIIIIKDMLDQWNDTGHLFGKWK